MASVNITFWVSELRCRHQELGSDLRHPRKKPDTDPGRRQKGPWGSIDSQHCQSKNSKFRAILPQNTKWRVTEDASGFHTQEHVCPCTRPSLKAFLQLGTRSKATLDFHARVFSWNMIGKMSFLESCILHKIENMENSPHGAAGGTQ